jgi:rare lipoprotein A
VLKRTILVACTAVALTSGEHPAFPATVLGYGYGQTAGQGEASGPLMDLRGLLPAAPVPDLGPDLGPYLGQALGRMLNAPQADAPSAPDTAMAQPVAVRDGAQGLAACASTGGDAHVDNAALTAAHRTLPLSSLAMVTDLDSKKEVIVRVSERGPDDADKVIALSPSASAALGCGASGQARVSVRYLGPGSLVPKQTAAAPAPVRPAPVAAAPFVQESASLTAPRGAYVVQIGAYSERANAERARERAEDAGRVSIEQAVTASGAIYRVRLGPWETRDDAERARRKAAGLGFRDARIATR